MKENIYGLQKPTIQAALSQSESIILLVDNIDDVSPNGYIAQPYAGQVVNGQVEILIYASDDVGVSSVNIFIKK